MTGKSSMQIMIILLKECLQTGKKVLLIECCYVPFAELTTELEGKKPEKDFKEST